MGGRNDFFSQAFEGTQAWKSDQKVEKRRHSHCQRIEQAWQKSHGSDGNPSKMFRKRVPGVDFERELPTWHSACAGGINKAPIQRYA